MAVQISLPAYGGPERRVRPRPLKECGNVRKVVHRLKRRRAHPLNDANVRQAGQHAAAHPEFFFNLFDGPQLDRFPHSQGVRPFIDFDFPDRSIPASAVRVGNRKDELLCFVHSFNRRGQGFRGIQVQSKTRS